MQVIEMVFIAKQRYMGIHVCLHHEWVNDCCLTPPGHFFRWDEDNDVLFVLKRLVVFVSYYSSSSVKNKSAGHIILIPSQPVLALAH